MGNAAHTLLFIVYRSQDSRTVFQKVIYICRKRYIGEISISFEFMTHKKDNLTTQSIPKFFENCNCQDNRWRHKDLNSHNIWISHLLCAHSGALIMYNHLNGKMIALVAKDCPLCIFCFCVWLWLTVSALMQRSVGTQCAIQIWTDEKYLKFDIIWSFPTWFVWDVKTMVHLEKSFVVNYCPIIWTSEPLWVWRNSKDFYRNQIRDIPKKNGILLNTMRSFELFSNRDFREM